MNAILDTSSASGVLTTEETSPIAAKEKESVQSAAYEINFTRVQRAFQYAAEWLKDFVVLLLALISFALSLSALLYFSTHFADKAAVPFVSRNTAEHFAQEVKRAGGGIPVAEINRLKIAIIY